MYYLIKIWHNMKRIQNRLYKIGNYDICKISFSCFDDNSYIPVDGINSLTTFHKGVRSQWNQKN